MSSVAESRANKRFVFEQPASAKFGSVAITLLDLSMTGFQALHANPILLGRKDDLVIPFGKQDRTLPATIRWSRAVTGAGSGKLTYRSGFLINPEDAPLASDVVDQFVVARQAFFDTESLEKKEKARRAKMNGPSSSPSEPKADPSQAQTLHLIMVARKHLRDNPRELNHWEHVAMRSCKTRPSRATLEIVTIWEFLQRRVPLDMIRLGVSLE
jgi:hypothetical protein